MAIMPQIMGVPSGETERTWSNLTSVSLSKSGQSGYIQTVSAPNAKCIVMGLFASDASEMLVWENGEVVQAMQNGSPMSPIVHSNLIIDMAYSADTITFTCQSGVARTIYYTYAS